MGNGDSKFRSRKFIFAMIFAGMAILITGYFGYQWRAKPPQVMELLLWFRGMAGMVLALYGLSTITDKKLNQGRAG